MRGPSLKAEERRAGAGADTLLGPEMRSTGEVMGIDSDFGRAYAKAAIAAGQKLPTSGNVFITMIDKYKEAIVPVAKQLQVEAILPSLLCVYACDPLHDQLVVVFVALN